MSSLQNSLKTHQLEPSFNTNNRCEFRIPPKTWYTNLRLTGLGLNMSADAGGNTVLGYYPYNAGAYQVIRNIYLYNNNTVIAQLMEAGRYLAFSNIQRSNGNSANMARSLTKNNWGFTNELNNTISYVDNGIPSAGTGSVNDHAYLDLRQCLPFLNATLYLQGEKMQNLRLVIEHESVSNLRLNPVNVVCTGGGVAVTSLTTANPCVFTVATPSGSRFAVGKTVYLFGFTGADSGELNGLSFTVTASTDTTITTNYNSTGKNIGATGIITLDPNSFISSIKEPSLLIDEVLDTSPVKNEPVSYVNIVSERLYLPVNQMNLTQRIRAFDNKLVRKLLFMNQSIDNVTRLGYQQFRSVPMLNEVMQFTLNGKQFLKYNGIDTAAKKIAMLNDVMGNVNIPQGSYEFMTDFNKAGLYSSEPYDANISFSNSYGCLPLNTTVSELEIVYTRGEYPNAASDADNGSDEMNNLSKQQLNMYVWGEVVKQMTVKDNEVSVVG